MPRRRRARLARRALAGWTDGPLPYDLVVFLDAAEAVLDGRSPFPDAATLSGDQNYVYPPLLALALIPLTALPTSVVVFLWVVVGIAAVAGSLWLLGVRDPWVYAIAFLYFVATAAALDADGRWSGPLLAVYLVGSSLTPVIGAALVETLGYQGFVVVLGVASFILAVPAFLVARISSRLQRTEEAAPAVAEEVAA